MRTLPTYVWVFSKYTPTSLFLGIQKSNKTKEEITVSETILLFLIPL